MPGFRELFWGFLFLFDFRLNGIDILPDVVGYFLLYNGLVKLEVYSSHFTSSSRLMILLAFLALPDIYSGWWYPGSTFNFVYHLAMLFLDLMAVYHLCRGVKELAVSRQNIDLVEKTNNRWLLYMIVSLISAVSLLGFPLLMLPLLITVLFIFAIAVLVLMMDLMKKCEAQLS